VWGSLASCGRLSIGQLLRKRENHGTHPHSPRRDPGRRVGRDKRNVTADTALRLSQYFGMSADFWMNLQSTYELDLARQQVGDSIQRIPQRHHASTKPQPVA